MNCEEITGYLAIISDCCDSFDSALNSHKINESLRIKTEIDSTFVKLKKILDPLGIKEASRILGSSFLGVDAVESVFGIKLKKEEIPKIPFTSEDLLRAKELNQVLLFRTNEFGNGRPITVASLQQFNEANGILDNFFVDSASILDVFNNFYSEIPRPGWVLVGRENVPKTTMKDFLTQIDRTIRYLEKDVFKFNTPAIYKKAFSEYGVERDQIDRATEDGNLAEAGLMLQKLEITKLILPTLVEALYDLLIIYSNTQEAGRLDSFRTSSIQMDGIINICGFSKQGIDIDLATVRHSDSDLGLRISRRS